MICLTEAKRLATYSRSYLAFNCDLNSMSNKYKETESPVVFLKNEAARQRWELFHRAIAHAKQSNNDALNEADPNAVDAESIRPLLTIVR